MINMAKKVISEEAGMEIKSEKVGSKDPITYNSDLREIQESLGA